MMKRVRNTVVAAALLLTTTPVVSAQAQVDLSRCPRTIAANDASIAATTQLQQMFQYEQVHALATGHGARIAIIDTGVATHPRLRPVIDGGNLIDDGQQPSAFVDCDVHGTVVASIIGLQPGSDGLVGLAPDAELITIKQSSANSAVEGTLATLIAAIDRALELNATVINMSIASCIDPLLAETVDLAPLQQALWRAEEQGAVLVAASGNTGGNQGCHQESVVFPASFEPVLAVAAVEPRVTGEHVEPQWAPYAIGVATPLAAPGHAYTSADPRSDGLAMARDRGEFIGTSFAAPFVAGTVALLQQRYPHETPAQIRQRIRASVDPATGVLYPYRALSQAPTQQVEQRSLALHPAAEFDRSYQQRLRWLVLSCAVILLGAALLLSGWKLRRNTTNGIDPSQ